MSKNFAEEYKTLANEELPDLWNRIEAGLTPKTTALAEKSHLQDMEQAERQADPEVNQVANQETEPKKTKEKSTVITFLFRYRTVVAAAVCVIVILPAVILLGKGNRLKSFSGSAADMTAEMPEEAAADDAVDIESEGMYLMESDAVAEEPEVEAAPEEAKAEAAAEEPGVEAGGTVFDRGADDAKAYEEAALTDDMNLNDAAEKERALSETQKSEQSSDLAADREAEILERVTLEAAEQTGETVEVDRDFFYGIRMKVIEDPSGELAEDTEITVWVSMSSSVAYVEGQEYVLDLSYDPGRECPYRVWKNHFS